MAGQDNKPDTKQGKAAQSSKACPMCSAPTKAKYAPFCSSRCADRDLHHWLAGSYVIAGDDGSAGSQDDEFNGH